MGRGCDENGLQLHIGKALRESMRLTVVRNWFPNLGRRSTCLCYDRKRRRDATEVTEKRAKTYSMVTAVPLAATISMESPTVS